MYRLVRVVSPKFVAGFETDGHVLRSAPILKFLLGKSDDEVRTIVRKNRWKAFLVVVEEEMVRDV